MAVENPLSIIGDMSKPVNTLIKKIADAIGVLYEPSRIVRKAKAEAKAQEIMAISEINVKEIQNRAFNRFVYEETRKQTNIENIIERTIPQIQANAQSEKIEEDWIVKFFESAKMISDIEMQSLWSRILAGETNNPGTFSRRTISLVAELDNKDAILFTNLCKFSFSIGKKITPVVFDTQEEIYNKQGINFRTLIHLDNAGLLQFNNLTGFKYKNLQKRITISYYTRPINIEFPNVSDNNLDIGRILLSQAGEELATICGSLPDEEIYYFTIEQWKKKGLIIT